MKWVITGILAVSAAAALAGDHMTFSDDNAEVPAATAIAKERAYMTFSDDGGGLPAATNQAKEEGDTPAAVVQANDPMGKPGYMTFSNDGPERRNSFYTTPGGCNAPRPPQVAEHHVQGVGALRFLESSYIHQVAARLEAAAGKCTCELRFPSWDAALKDMEDRFIPLPDDESSAWVRDYARPEKSRVRREVDKICKAQGVY